jgi:hypothetical protein
MKIFIILLLSIFLITNILHAHNLQYDSNVGQMLLRGFFKIMRNPDFAGLSKEQQLTVFYNYRLLFQKHLANLNNLNKRR